MGSFYFETITNTPAFKILVHVFCENIPISLCLHLGVQLLGHEESVHSVLVYGISIFFFEGFALQPAMYEKFPFRAQSPAPGILKHFIFNCSYVMI